MATITNYASLQSQIAAYLNRQDLTDQIPVFIQFVEADVNTQLRAREQIVRSEATSSAEFVTLPSDWLEAISFRIVGGRSPLRFVTLDQANVIKDNREYTDVSFYSLMDGAIELVPAPAVDVEIEMVYYASIPTLSTSNTTNWLLTKAPDIYLYGALVHASPFLMDDQRTALFAGLFTSRLSALQDASTRGQHSGGPLLVRTRSHY